MACFVSVCNAVVLLARTCIKGETTQTAIIVFNDWASQEISLHDDSKAVEVQWTVGPIPIDDHVGKEIILRYDTNIQSAGKFYTDSNGREVLERRRDYRPTWNYTKIEAVSGNYYPINSRIWIKEAARQLTVLTGKCNDQRMSVPFSFVLLQIDRKVVAASGMVRSRLCYIDARSTMMHSV